MTNPGKVLVTGATGNTGSRLVPALKNSGVDVRAFVRDEEKARPLKEMGVEIVSGNLDRPETIAPAVEGVDKIYLLTWNGPSQKDQAENVIAAAKEVGNPHIVRHSMWGSPNSRIVKQGDQIEATLMASGLPWTILQPTFFMQNTMMAAQTIAENGVVYWDTGDGKLGMVDVRDVADSAFAVLTGEGHEGKRYILTGPEAISFHEVARIFSDVLGKEISYVKVPHEASRESMVAMGFPDWIARGYGELMDGFGKNFANRVTDSVATLTGHPPGSFEQFARDFAQVFGG